MMQARGISILSAVNRIGFFATVYQTIILTLIKLGIKKSIKVKNVGQVYLRKNTSDISVYRQIFFDGEYDIHVKEDPRGYYRSGWKHWSFCIVNAISVSRCFNNFNRA